MIKNVQGHQPPQGLQIYNLLEVHEDPCLKRYGSQQQLRPLVARDLSLKDRLQSMEGPFLNSHHLPWSKPGCCDHHVSIRESIPDRLDHLFIYYCRSGSKETTPRAPLA